MPNNYVLLDEISVKAGVSFNVLDDFTGKMPAGAVSVSIENSSIKPVKNNYGYYTFTGLTAGSYNFIIKNNYFASQKITLKLENNSPSVSRQVNLIPLPSYQFPEGSTVIKGTVVDNISKAPVAGAGINLKLKGVEKNTVSDEQGKFVIYLANVNEKMIKGKMIKSHDDSINLNLVFSKKGYQNDNLFLISSGNKVKIDKINWEFGRLINLEKNLKNKGA